MAYRDIATAYGVRIPANLVKMMTVIAHHQSDLFSCHSMAKSIGSDVEATENYIDYLKKSFLVWKRPVFASINLRQFNAFCSVFITVKKSTGLFVNCPMSTSHRE